MLLSALKGGIRTHFCSKTRGGLNLRYAGKVSFRELCPALPYHCVHSVVSTQTHKNLQVIFKTQVEE